MNAMTTFPIRPSELRVSWTDETIETAKRLSAEGKSATVIANALRAENPGITRNAVIGKLHRLGCAGGGHQPSKDKARAPSQLPRIKRHAAPQIASSGLRPTVQALREIVPASRRGTGARKRTPRVELHVECDRVLVFGSITISDLNEDVCHFPYGDPRDLETFRYCGSFVGEGERYCGGHRRMMYAPRHARREA